MNQKEAEKIADILKDTIDGGLLKFKDMAGEFLISQKEAEKIADILKDTIDGGLLKDMYASDYRYSFAREIMQPVFEQVTSEREKIILPQQEEMFNGIRMLLENADADKE